MVFEKRALATPDTLGQRLQQLREELRISLDSLARELGISVKYLTAIEEGRYHDLPGPVYARNFVRRYIARVNLDQAAAMDRFESEYRVMAAVHPTNRPMIRQPNWTKPAWWREHLRLLLAGAVIALVLGYFGWQVFTLFQPPSLVVFEPAGDVATLERQIEVSGQTEPGASVSINRQAAAVSPSGQFREQVDLQPGLNVLQIATKNPRSRERIVVRNVLVEQQP